MRIEEGPTAYRIDTLELLLQEHYCVAFGVKNGQGILQNFGFKRFAAAPPPPRFSKGD